MAPKWRFKHIGEKGLGLAVAELAILGQTLEMFTFRNDQSLRAPHSLVLPAVTGAIVRAIDVSPNFDFVLFCDNNFIFLQFTDVISSIDVVNLNI